MRIHKEGYLIILISIVTVAAIIPLTGMIEMAAWIHYLIWVVLILLLLWIVRFFRSPRRGLIPDENLVICPADGKVVAIEEVHEPEFFGDKRKQISVFMSPNNVHVNWSPVSGTVKYMKYHPGKYLVAWHPKSSTENERTTVVIENEQGTAILLRQIAGAMARRIVCYAREGNTIRQGDEFGFIKFGSRVDIYLLVNAEINVVLGQKVTGKQTIIARIQ